MKIRYKVWLYAAVLLAAACNKQIDDIKPLTKITVDGELATIPGLEAATTGNYGILAGNFQFYQQDLGEDRGNNVKLQTWGPPAQYTDAFFYENSNNSSLGSSYGFYQASYQLILSVNTVLDAMASIDTTALTADDRAQWTYMRGENLFMRAMTYFYLVRIYGKPFYQDGGASLSVPIKSTASVTERPSPSATKDVYAYVINDLQAAASLMKASTAKANTFASPGVVWALLSRVYLYMGGSVAKPDAASNQLAVTYADSAIGQTGYVLLQGQTYQNMFGSDLTGSLGRSNPNGNKEIIFAFDNETSLYGTGIGMLYHHDNIYGEGAVFLPSSDIQSQFVSADVRGGFFALNSSSGFVETTKWLCLNNYTGTKAPSILLRLGEVYLNRAEAEAKMGDLIDARVDLKTIHVRAGLPGSDVDALADGDVLSAVLKERRLELAFEGHCGYDYYRNGLPMTRLAADYNGTVLTIQPDDPKVVFTIPNN